MSLDPHGYTALVAIFIVLTLAIAIVVGVIGGVVIAAWATAIWLVVALMLAAIAIRT